MAGIFKAYDVRGLYPSQLNEEMARKIGLAFRNVLDEDDFACGNTVIVSRDMRSHSVPLQQALIEGLRASGLDVLDIGLATTPMSYFAVGHLKAVLGAARFGAKQAVVPVEAIHHRLGNVISQR